MAKFIEFSKIKQLREAAKNGDMAARKILDMQMNGEDFGTSLEDYFNKPKVEVGTTTTTSSLPKEKSNLEKFLEFNNITKDSPDYESFVEDFYKEFPNEKPQENTCSNTGMLVTEEDCFITPLIREEIKAINDYNEAIMKVMEMDELGDAAKRGLIAKLEEIKRDEMEHLEELKRMKIGLDKKEEKVETKGEIL